MSGAAGWQVTIRNWLFTRLIRSNEMVVPRQFVVEASMIRVPMRVQEWGQFDYVRDEASRLLGESAEEENSMFDIYPLKPLSRSD